MNHLQYTGGQGLFPAAQVSRSRVGASRAPSALLRSRFATLDPPTRSQEPAAIREQDTTGHHARSAIRPSRRTLVTTMTGARSHYARSPRF
jgi:hypothetical protein